MNSFRYMVWSLFFSGDGVKQKYSICRFVFWVLPFWFAVSGCRVGPEYQPPVVPEPEDWINRDASLKSGDPDALADWWTLFQDPALESLIQKASAQNLSLQAAGIRILEARANLGIAVGNQFPQFQNLNADYTRQTGSKNAANTAPGGDFHFGQLAASFDMAWELDLWGQYRRAVEAGMADVEASEAFYQDTLVILTAEVARAYVQIRTLQRQLVVARRNIELQTRSLEIATVQFEAGQTTELDVQQAKSLLAETKGRLPQLESDLRQTRHALSILLGELPGSLESSVMEEHPIPAVPANVVVGAPAEMLRRRPDLRAVERQLASQCARIGIAQADLYPHFSLAGSIGFRTSDADRTARGYPGGSELKNLFDSSSIEWFAGPTLSWDVLNYGRLENRVRVEDARFQGILIAYRNIVLNAVREVEDSIAAFLLAQEEARYQAERVAASLRSVELANIQYAEGLVDYQRVLDTQRSLASAEDRQAFIQGSVVTNLIAMYKALGGGWESLLDVPIVDDETENQMRRRTNWGNVLEPISLESAGYEPAP